MAVKLVILAALVAVLSAAGYGRADSPSLVGAVGLGDSYSISLKDATGKAVTHLDPGTYTLLVHDYSALHNFDLNGPGVSVATGVDTVGDQTFTITDGTYFFQCDAHVGQMHGSFTVGSVTTSPPTTTPVPPVPAPATKLAASIGPGATFSLRPASGLSAGTYKITVSDRSASDGFRLAGSGVTRATGVKFKGSVTWAVTLKAGKYSFGSLRNAKHRRLVTISA